MAQVIVQSPDAKNIVPLIQSALYKEISLLELSIERTQTILHGFEKKYGMESLNFYHDFMQGKLGDDFDFIEWAGEYEMLEKITKQLETLKDVVVCS